VGFGSCVSLFFHIYSLKVEVFLGVWSRPSFLPKSRVRRQGRSFHKREIRTRLIRA
jgi:hypothetical protein